MRRLLLVVVAFAAVAVACGLTAVGEQAIGVDGTDGGASSTSASSSGAASGSSSGGTTDGGTESGADANIECDSGAGTWNVLLPADGGACPAGTVEQTVKTNPVAKDGACTCGTCTVSKEASCSGQNFHWRWGGDNQCSNDSGGQDYDVTADNACVQIFSNNTTLAAYNRWTRTPAAGICAATAGTDATKVDTTAVRQCVPTGSGCPAPTATDRLCVNANPDGGACPTGYTSTIVIGDGPKVDACTACGCARTGTACHVEYHGNSGCTDKRYERNADGACSPTGSIQMQRIKVYPTGLACATTPGTATVSLTNQRTLCCTP